MSGATTPVAKKKSTKGEQQTPEGPRMGLVAVKCHLTWKDWLARFAKQQRTTPSQLIDVALLRHASESGFEPPPER